MFHPTILSQNAQDFWESIRDLYTAIIQHPFNRELAQGTLSRDRFLYYLQQDALYLLDYGKALSILAARSETPERRRDFIRFASGIFTVEEGMHQIYFTEYGVKDPIQTKSPACFAYTNFLLATVSLRSYEEGVASILPCFWVYREVGLSIYRGMVKPNPYERWIETYAGNEFGEATERAIEVLEETLLSASEGTRNRMLQAFLTSTRLEWLFWDSAYRLEQWKP
ncbi:MAG: thiaminase II [Spirochaetes bacterium]|nr:thiaminase II [Spirochaetota bacterium]